MLNCSFWTKAQNTVAIDNREKDLQAQGCETKKLNRNQTQGAQVQCHIMEPKERKRGEPYPIKHLQLFDLTVLTDYHVKKSSDRENLCSQSYSKRPKRGVFFHIVLERNMQLHPRHFGRNLRENLVSDLMKDAEGTCSGRHGFVVAITGIENIGKGLIRDGTGFVTFPVKNQCVVFRPFKGRSWKLLLPW
ncbi:hypothetical protein ES332_D05G100700v1 [Gossypium tomentosum]|uniref:DNA-directed RNA polymerase subunit n=1 Tax=Gossypium tomentosum TaxID=34277 RepID=A0A5D2KTM1_GOSTO|nr:hypothetical protein ES332_D05G100700v1 [Gossypium tomentosum]